MIEFSYLDFAVRSLFVTVIGLLVLVVNRRSSASLRHAIAVATLIAVIITGPLTAISQMAFIPIAVLPASSTPNPAKPEAPEASADHIAPPARTPAPALVAGASAPRAIEQTPTAFEPLPRTGLFPLVTWSVSGLLFARLMLSLSLHLRMRRRASLAPVAFEWASDMAASETGLARSPRVVIDSNVTVPLALVAPTSYVLLPQDSAGWSASRLRAVLLHEFAHVKRHESIWQLIAEVACAVQWWNPAVWLLRLTVRDEAERAADDIVLDCGVRPADYATDLVQIARNLQIHVNSAFASPMARRPAVADRVRSILARGQNRSKVGRADIAYVVAMASVVSFGLAGTRLTPRPMVQHQLEIPVVQGKVSRAPGDVSNGFVSHLDANRLAKVVEVFEYAEGKRTSWKPDGTRIPDSKCLARNLRMVAGQGIQVIVRVPEFERSRPIDFEGDPGRGKYQVKPGKAFVGPDGNHYQVVLAGQDAAGPISFSLRFFEKSKEITGVIKAHEGTGSVNPPAEAGAKWKGEPDGEIWKSKVHQTKQGIVRIKMGAPESGSGGDEFADPLVGVSPSVLAANAKARPRFGKSKLVIDTSLQFAGRYRLSVDAVLKNGVANNCTFSLIAWDKSNELASTYFFAPLDEIDRFRVYVQTAEVATFYGVSHKPNRP